jgi:DNA-binding NarL/FixJ family response regulator
MSQTIKVLLTDDHAIVRSGLKRLLERNGDIEIIAEAESGEQGYQFYSEYKPDVMVMDMTMPGIGGLEALRRIIAREKTARVIIFSMHDSASFAIQAMTAGAMGYVVKSGDMEDMIKAVRQAAIGKTYFCTTMAQKVALSSVSGDDDPMSLLSAREFEVFCFLAQGMVVEDIAECLNIGQKTVANYQTILKNKLGVNSPVELVRLALKYGVIQH